MFPQIVVARRRSRPACAKPKRLRFGGGRRSNPGSLGETCPGVRRGSPSARNDVIGISESSVGTTTLCLEPAHELGCREALAAIGRDLAEAPPRLPVAP